jgi:hypothetical protein
MPSATSYYFPTDPPYFLFLASLLAGLICGKSFEMTLRHLVQGWSSHPSATVMLSLKGREIQVPYLGMGVSICVFMACGLEIFGFPAGLAYTVALPITVGITYFVWRQLGKLLVELEKGGSAAMDLDIMEG